MSIFSRNDRLINRYRDKAVNIQKYIDAKIKISDEELKNSFLALKDKCRTQGFDSVRDEGLALCSLAMMRATGLRPFDVQLIGAMVLLESKIAQMRTGEGKTLTASLAGMVRALEGKGVHIVTVNEYLVKRDSDQTASISRLVGLTTSYVFSNQDLESKKQAYNADITYATNSELGFDFLRNNMMGFGEDHFMRPFHFAVVDEIDSILIDEARTPLIISEPNQEDPHIFQVVDKIAQKLIRSQDNLPNTSSEDKDAQKSHLTLTEKALQKISLDSVIENGDFIVDEKKKSVHLTEEGFSHLEEILLQEGLLNEKDSLYSVHNLPLLYHVEAALKAHHLFRNNIEYIVRDNEVCIVDEYTGRILAGRRWGNGLHQAIEAKENVAVQKETRVAASITLQNLFREYPHLGGMTGTAQTEASEFMDIYGLEVVIIPTHRPMIRNDMHDSVFLTNKAKISAILEDIKERHEKGQPILVGTTNVEASEILSGILHTQNIPHNVLNAKNHEKEAHIVAQAGKKGAITIATNMAGRGTDIILGGNIEEDQRALPTMNASQLKDRWKIEHDEVVSLGGLHVIGTERHESRRIDDQLRGRAGRQGDPGSSRFYVSFDDDLMRLFGTGWAKDTLQVMGMGERPIESAIVTKQILKAQKAVENQYFGARKELLDYDNVANEQRRHMYDWRKWILNSQNHGEYVDNITASWAEHAAKEHFSQNMLSSLDETQMEAKLSSIHPIFHSQNHFDNLEDIQEHLYKKLRDYIHDQKLEERLCQVALQETDHFWREHLAQLEYLRKGIYLRGFAQKDPKQEYKKDAYRLFEGIIEAAIESTISRILPRKTKRYQGWSGGGDHYLWGEKPSRNGPCSCQSGKKYKYCHGKIEKDAGNEKYRTPARILATMLYQGKPIPQVAYIFSNLTFKLTLDKNEKMPQSSLASSDHQKVLPKPTKISQKVGRRDRRV